jgi:Ca2+-transporting ATPase
VLLVVAVYFPPLSRVLTMVVPTPFQWLFILGMSLIPLVVVQILKQGAFFYKETQEKRLK